jgi:hypothetical protein
MKAVDPVLLWIVGSGLLMSAIALVGSVVPSESRCSASSSRLWRSPPALFSAGGR